VSSLSLGPDRDRVLDHAAQIVSRTWAEFDVARDTNPQTSPELEKLLEQGLPQDPSDPIAALDIAAEALDSSLTQARPRYLAYIGSSGLEIGALGDLLAHSHDPNLALDAGTASDIERQAIAWLGEVPRVQQLARVFHFRWHGQQPDRTSRQHVNSTPQ